MNKDHVVCPRCDDRWYEDLDEEGNPYTCFCCCNGTVKPEDKTLPTTPDPRWILPK